MGPYSRSDKIGPTALCSFVMGLATEVIGVYVALTPLPDGASRTVGEVLGFVAHMTIWGWPAAADKRTGERSSLECQQMKGV